MAATIPNTPTLTQAMARKKANPLPALLLGVGLLIAVGAAILGYLESQKTEQVVVLVRDVPYGRQLVAEDVGTVELALHRPAQLTGLGDPALVVGQYAARNLGVNDLIQPGMLMATPPTQPVYPNGQQLSVNMVPVPFAVGALGPVTDHDRVNLGFTDTTGDPSLCDAAKTATASEAPSSVVAAGPGATGLRPYACRLLSYVRVLWGELPHTYNSLHIEAESEGDDFSRAVRFTLRQKPRYVVVGEVRGGEAIAMLQGAATGHPGICTVHANDVQTALRNIERNAMVGLAAQSGGGGQAAAAIARGLMTTTNLVVVHIGTTPRGRRSVLEVAEVLISGAQGQSGDKFPTNTLFRYDPSVDQLLRTSNVQLPWGHGRY